MTIRDHGELSLLVCIKHVFSIDRLGDLATVLGSIYDLGAAHVDIAIFTDVAELAKISVLKTLLSKFEEPWLTISVLSYPEVSDSLQRLSWAHKRLMKQRHNEGDYSYTHYLYLEGGMLFSPRNFEYFLSFRAGLKSFGLVPGMLRYEFNEVEGDVFVVDQQEKQSLSNKGKVICHGIEFVSFDVPYAAMFILDRELMDEYLSSRSFTPESSASVVLWGELERAAMGIAWEKVPPGFQSRYVVPLRRGTAVPDAMCWVRHLPDTFTNNYTVSPNFNIGKIRMDEVFSASYQQPGHATYISCQNFSDNSCKTCYFLEELYPLAVYQRPLPDVGASEAFQAKLEDVYNSMNRLNGTSPRSVLVSFTSAYVFGSVIYVENGKDLALLYETHRPNDRGYVSAPHPSKILDASVIYKKEPNTCVIFIGSAGSPNYGHWLVDDLPRLKAVHVLREKFPDSIIKILYSSFGDPIDVIRRESTDNYLSAIKNYVVELLDHSIPWKIENLYYASPVSSHPTTKAPAAIEWVWEHARSTRKISPAPSSRSNRIFVTRRPPFSRVLLNHEEVAEFLSRYGFSIVDVHGLNFAQQLDIFRQADFVVGCMGAAMTNTIFCKQPATILMLAPEGWVEPFYWDLACVRGDKYLACYGEPNNSAVAPHESSYTIDVDMLPLQLIGSGR